MKQINSKIEIFSPAELEQIHQATLEVLSTVGCHLPHRRILEKLDQAGIEVDYSSARVKLPAAFMEKVMAKISKVKRAEEVDGLTHSLTPKGQVLIHPGNQANIIDYPSLTRRRGTTEDVIKGLVLCNELPFIWQTMPLVTPADVPAEMGDLYGYYLCALYSRKPYRMYIMSPESAHQAIRIARIVGGENPGQISFLLEPNGALSYDDISLEMALIFAESGHSFYLAPMAMTGLDAPATLAGTLVMQNAYNWIGNVVAYLWNTPGSWGGSAHTMDLRSSLCSFGSPNQVLIALGAIQLANWYGFETAANTALTDACLPDFQSGFEKGMSAVVTLLAGGSYGCQGIVGADQGTSFEQLVIDNEWASALNHIFSHGIEVNQETLGVDAIKRAGILGNFLTDEHTLKHMRQTYWRSSIFNYESWDVWYNKGAKDSYARAHELVEKILAQHYPPQPAVSEPVQAQLKALIEDCLAHPQRFLTEKYRYIP